MGKCFENYSHHSNTVSLFVLLLGLETKAFLRLKNWLIWGNNQMLYKWPTNLLAFQKSSMLCGSQVSAQLYSFAM